MLREIALRLGLGDVITRPLPDNRDPMRVTHSYGDMAHITERAQDGAAVASINVMLAAIANAHQVAGHAFNRKHSARCHSHAGHKPGTCSPAWRRWSSPAAWLDARQSKASNTWRNYKTQWRQFTDWCNARGRDPMPAKEEVTA